MPLIFATPSADRVEKEPWATDIITFLLDAKAVQTDP